MQNSPLRAGALGLFAVATLAMSVPASAADSDLIVRYTDNGSTITRSKAVEISDLKLSSAEGRRTLDNRIKRAAKVVCDYNIGDGLKQSDDYRQCFETAKANAYNDAGLIQTASR